MTAFPRYHLPAALALLLTAGAPGRAATAPLSEPARWLQGYLRIDSTQSAGEAAAAEYLAAVLRREGIGSTRFVSPAGHTSLIARLPATTATPEAEGLLLLHHLDVVAAGAGWTRPPFGGEVHDGALWGRGALDAKGLGVAQLAAFVELARSRAPRRREVLFAAVGGEEVGGTEGTGWLFARHSEVFAGVGMVLNEGGSARKINGRLLWWEIEVAQKRPLWLAVEARGRGGHASGLNPHSAVHRLIAALARLLERPPRYRVTAPARAYFGALAPLHNDLWQRIFLDLDRAVGPEGPREAMLPGMPNLFLDTIQVTMLEGGPQINVMPATARARIDVRLLPDTPAEELLAEIRERLGGDVTVEVLLTAPPAEPSPITNAAYQALVAALSAEAPVVPAFKPGFTDSRWFRERGIPAYGVSPFAPDQGEGGGIHGPDERLRLDELARGVMRLAGAVRHLATAVN